MKSCVENVEIQEEFGSLKFDPSTLSSNGENKKYKIGGNEILLLETHLQFKLQKKKEDLSVIFKQEAESGQFPCSEGERLSNSNGYVRLYFQLVRVCQFLAFTVLFTKQTDRQP